MKTSFSLAMFRLLNQQRSTAELLQGSTDAKSTATHPFSRSFPVVIFIEISYINLIQIMVQFGASILVVVTVVVVDGAQTEVVGECTSLASVLGTQAVFAHFVCT